MGLTINERAAERFNELGEEMLPRVIAETRTEAVKPGFKPDVHFSANLSSADVVGPIKAVESAYDGTGAEVGRFFLRNDRRIGLVGEAFKDLVRLLERIQKSGLSQTASIRKLLDTAFVWLEERYENRTRASIVTFLLARIEPDVREREVWMPLHRVYMERPITIGTVRLQTITKEMLDDVESRLREHAPPEALTHVTARMESDRKKLQGTTAASIRVVAEPIRASELALEKAEQAVALLRFFSAANWHPLMRSYCTLLGDEALRINTELIVTGGKISKICSGVDDDRNQKDWLITHAHLQQFPNLLALLSDISDESQAKSDFQRKLLEALVLYSGNSVAQKVADKLVYILASLESILLKNDSEPIQKNLGERMAFLIGPTVEARKTIIANVVETYARRSSFVHHGQGIDSTDTLATFMLNTWTCFYRMLEVSTQFQTKDAFIQSLEDRKLQ
jgi:hypothetical protein